MVAYFAAQGDLNDCSGLVKANIHSEEHQVYLDCTLVADVRDGSKAGITETPDAADYNSYSTLMQYGDQNAQYQGAAGMIQVSTHCFAHG
jgi:hypothetical protein